MKYLMLLFISVVGLLGCKPVQPVSDSNTLYDTVFVETKIVERDTVIITPKSFVSTAVSVDELDTTEVVKTNDNARVIIKKYRIMVHDTVKEFIHVRAECDTLRFNAKLQDRHIKKEHLRSSEVVKTNDVKYIPFIYKVLSLLGLVLILYVAYRIVSLKYKIKNGWFTKR